MCFLFIYSEKHTLRAVVASLQHGLAKSRLDHFLFYIIQMKNP